MAPKVDTKKHCHCTGPAPSEEVAPWNPSTARDQALPEDNRTLYPKGSLFVVNKGVEDFKNTCIVVICTNVGDVKDCKKYMYCSYLHKCQRRQRYLKCMYLFQDDQAHQHPRVEVYEENGDY